MTIFAPLAVVLITGYTRIVKSYLFHIEHVEVLRTPELDPGSSYLVTDRGLETSIRNSSADLGWKEVIGLRSILRYLTKGEKGFT